MEKLKNFSKLKLKEVYSKHSNVLTSLAVVVDQIQGRTENKDGLGVECIPFAGGYILGFIIGGPDSQTTKGEITKVAGIVAIGGIASYFIGDPYPLLGSIGFAAGSMTRDFVGGSTSV